MDSVDIQNFEEDIEEIQARVVKAANHEGSEDDADELIEDLGRRLGYMVYDDDGYKTKLNRAALKEVGTYIGTIGGNRHNPALLIENPLNEYKPIVVPIIEPTDQFPES